MSGAGIASILVVAALPAELPPRLADIGAEGLLAGARARRLPPRLPGEGPVLVTGTCGALVPGWPPGTLVLPESVGDAAGVQLPDDAWCERLLRAAESAGIPLRRGRLVEVASFVDGPGERRQLASRAPAELVDLESARIARRCDASGRPWAVLRVVTDAPDAPLGWLATLLGGMPEGQPSAVELLAGLARRPWMLPKLVKLGRVALGGRSQVRRIIAEASRG